MIEYKFYTMEEFNKFENDIKWDIYSEMVAELRRYKSIVWICEKVKDCDKNE